MRTLFASATRDEQSQDVILKIVNSAADAVETEIDLNAANLPGTAKAIVLTSASPKDENTLEEPLKVSPRAEDFRFSGSRFTRSFPETRLLFCGFTPANKAQDGDRLLCLLCRS